MSARLIFFIITTIIIFLIVFANSYLIVRLTKMKRRSAWFWRLVLLQITAIVGTTYYQMAQVQLLGTSMYEFWRAWATGTYGLLMGLGVGFAILIPLGIVMAAVNWRAKKQRLKNKIVVANFCVKPFGPYLLLRPAAV